FSQINMLRRFPRMEDGALFFSKDSIVEFLKFEKNKYINMNLIEGNSKLENVIRINLGEILVTLIQSPNCLPFKLAVRAGLYIERESFVWLYLLNSLPMEIQGFRDRVFYFFISIAHFFLFKKRQWFTDDFWKFYLSNATCTTGTLKLQYESCNFLIPCFIIICNILLGLMIGF
ncbi:hypothetical protein ACJX0J_025973, partial [Zea mays]